MLARRQEPSESSASPESEVFSEASADATRYQGDITKIPTSDSLAAALTEQRAPGQDRGTNEKDPPMHRVIIRRNRVSSPSPKMSPILSMTKRGQIPQQLLNPIAPSMPSRRSLGARNRLDEARDGRVSPGRDLKPLCVRAACRTPPVPLQTPKHTKSSSQLSSRREEFQSQCRTPPVRSPLFTSRGYSSHTARIYSQPSRHSLGTTAVRSSSGDRGSCRVKVVTLMDKDEAGRTPLMHAARKGDLMEVRGLLEAGCWVNDLDSCKCTALMYAATYGHVPVAKCLVHHNADVNAQSHDKWTPLIAACYNGHVSMADFLLSKGANLESCDERGWTGLMHCAFNGRLDILRCLLQRGALVEKEDFEGRTALVYAAFSGHLESVKLLLACGRLQQRGTGADLALMFAADKGHLEIVRAFLDAAGAAKPIHSIRSALELAQSHGHHEVVHLLAAKV